MHIWNSVRVYYCLPVLLLLACASRLSAGVALLVSEPFGRFGFFNPTGHASIYSSGICAETPTTLRPCRPGESGVVISRYNRIDGRDWIAVPLLPYLYAVNHPEEVPALATPELVAQLRAASRDAHFPEIDGGDWVQLVGAAYDRSIHGFALDTSPEDDLRLIEQLNSRPNSRRFNLLYRNCADFARSLINFYYPGALRRGILADAGISTPKHSAKSLVDYCRRRPGLRLRRFLIPQVPGMRRSTRINGVSESLVRSKKYVAPLLVLQPWVAATAAAAYLAKGRFNPAAQPQNVCTPEILTACAFGPDLVADQASASDLPPALMPKAHSAPR